MILEHPKRNWKHRNVSPNTPSRGQRLLVSVGASAAMLLLSTQAFGAPWGELPSPQAPAAAIVYDIDDFAILVKDRISIPRRFNILPDPDQAGTPGRRRADIGAQGPNKGNMEPLAEGKISLGQVNWVTIPTEANDRVFKDSAIVAGEYLELLARAQVVDVISGSGVVDTDPPGPANPTVTDNAHMSPLVTKGLGQNDFPLIPDLATFDPSDDPADDVICPRGDVVHLMPGTYRDLEIRKNCSLILDAAGDYIFRRITTHLSLRLVRPRCG